MPTFLILFLLPFIAMAHTNQELFDIYQKKNADYQPRTRHINNNQAQFVNHLILANSPYLLQHAHNPVNWFSFDDESFKLAKQQNKLIFLSIGYATCHWCHVMEEESFEDLEVAKVLNKDFISIKVDREVLPDVDNHFMNISQLLNGNGGWPLNVILTPDGEGFFAGTYFPKNDLINNLNHLQTIWQTDKARINKTVKGIKNALIQQNSAKVTLDNNLQTTAVNTLLLGFDEFYGGFGDAPKFPHEAQLLMLIDEQTRKPNAAQLDAITITLNTMASGGIYDEVAGGFARYATDPAWLFPHFEKMLYNQAQLAVVYIKAYQLTGKYLYKRTAVRTLDYVIKEMKNIGFYSATDADSEGEEGLFFTWPKEELQQILKADFSTFEQYFDLSKNSEFESRHVIHYQYIKNLTKKDFDKIQPLLAQLYKHRQLRIKPLLDNKILLSWNALLLKSFALASEIDDKYLLEAQNLAQFLMANFYRKTLKRVHIDNVTSQTAIFEDYAYFADALLALFDVNEEQKYLINAQKLMDEAIEKFWDKKHYGFKISNNKRIDNNAKEIYDGAIPSSNGVAYGVLNLLADRVQNEKYRQLSEQLLGGFSSAIAANPSAYPTLVKNFNDHQHTQLKNVAYAYNGKIKISVKADKIILKIAKGWHINANQVLQKALIATTLSSDNFKHINYPAGQKVKLGFSKEDLAIYQNTINIDYVLKNPLQTTATLAIQACSDKVCLPPQSLLLLINP